MPAAHRTPPEPRRTALTPLPSPTPARSAISGPSSQSTAPNRKDPQGVPEARPASGSLPTPENPQTPAAPRAGPSPPDTPASPPRAAASPHRPSFPPEIDMA